MAFAVVSAGRCPWEGVGRVVAVGDVHGDFYRFAAILQAAGIIDGSKNWCGGKTRFVQTGDILDRGPDSRMVMDLLMKLEKQAPLQGGAVHLLIGNHEAMLMEADLRYVHEGEILSHGGLKKMVRSMRPGGFYGGWLGSHESVIRINNALFLHAGLSGEFSSLPPQTINEQVRKELADRHIESTGILEWNGPLWYRGWVDDRSSSVERSLEETLERAGAEYTVVGHTVAIQGITTRFGGRVVMIDTGISACYGGPLQYLEMDQHGWKAVEITGGEQ